MKSEIKWKSRYGPVDISLIKEFENKIGFKFPRSYIEIVSEYDAGRVANHKSAFQFFSNLIDEIEIYGLGCFLMFGKPDSGGISTMNYYWDTRNEDPDYPFPDNVVPFGLDGGGNLICFDYRDNLKTSEPKIVVWHHEGCHSPETEISYVANNFDEFLDMLHDTRTEEEKIEDANFKWSWDK